MSKQAVPMQQQNIDIRMILNEKHLVVHFQEIVSLNRKSVIGVEGLIRGVDPETNDIIPPLALFEIAHQEGLILELDRLCRDLVLEEFSRCYSDDKSKLLFLNLSASLLDEVAGSKYLLKQAQEHRVMPGNVVIEINEKQVMDISALIEFSETYRKLGFMIALDDVGTGFSNMDRILHVRPDIIKVDRSLIKHINIDYYKQGVFQSLVHLSSIIGALVIAEGVETQEEVIGVLKLGGHMMQGYYFSKPHRYDISDFESPTEKISSAIARFNRDVAEKRSHDKEKSKQLETVIDMCIKDLSEVDPNQFDHKLLQITWSNRDIECAYIIDENGIQISNTIRYCEESDIKDNIIFYSAVPGTDHTMAQYYYPMKSGGLKQHVTAPYVSLATGNLCVTVSKMFINQQGESYILCLDFHTMESGQEFEPIKEMNISNLVFNINGKSMSEINSMITKMNEEIIKDCLTNTYNRRYMEERLLVDVFNAMNAGQPISVILADIDHFKNVNDIYGHLAGDHVLKEFVKIAKNNIRKSNDWIARYGGEEFLIVLLNANEDIAFKVAEKIRKAIEAETFRYHDESIMITSSFGVYTLKNETLTYDELIRKADNNLYEAKETGRNKTVVT